MRQPQNHTDDFTGSFLNELTSHPINLPPFPALTSLEIYFIKTTPSAHVIDTLSSISSVPVLAFITLDCLCLFPFKFRNSWDRLDGLLSQMAEKTTVEGGLVLTFARWQENWAPEVLLPKFGEVGKTIVDRLDPNTSPWELEGTPTSIVEEFLAKRRTQGNELRSDVSAFLRASDRSTRPILGQPAGGRNPSRCCAPQIFRYECENKQETPPELMVVVGCSP